MSKLFFSIIIPTYNQSNYLEKAIKSVLLQKENYEIIIIDNFSDDNTEEIVKKYKSDKFKYYKINNDGVIGKSRNLGIKNASAPWVAFLDSDDVWHKDKLEVIENFLKKNLEFDVITNDEEILYEGSKKKDIWKYGPYTQNFYKKLILDGSCVSTSASVVKKSFLKEKKILFSEKKTFSSVEDYDFFLNLAFNNAKFKFFHQTLGQHLFHNKSFSRNFEMHHKALESVLYYHINSKQKFTNNKKLLTKKINTNLSIIKAFDEIRFNKAYIKAFTILLKNFLINPLYLMLRIIKKLYLKFET
tara:strand:- start:194 stop:1096 length:903 start_codon:yes stop_codon:yes gene_type:complete